MNEETVTVRVQALRTGREIGRFQVPADTTACVRIEQGPSQVVLYMPGIDLPVVFIGAAQVSIERRRNG